MPYTAAISHANHAFDFSDVGLINGLPGSALLSPQLADQTVFPVVSDPAGQGSFDVIWEAGFTASTTPHIDVVGLLNVTHDNRVGLEVSSITVSLFNTGGSNIGNHVFGVQDFLGATFPRHIWLVLPIVGGTSVAAKVKVTVAFGAADFNTLVNFGVGALWVGPVWVHPVGLDTGWSIRPVDPGAMVVSNGGQGYPLLRQIGREFRGSFGPLDWPGTFGQSFMELPPVTPDVQEIIQRLGTTTHCVLFPRYAKDDDGESRRILHRTALYGFFVDPGSINHLADDNWSWGPVTFRELF